MFGSLGSPAKPTQLDYSKALILAIESAIDLAMRSARLIQLHATCPNADEDTITCALQEALIDIRKTHSSFSEAVFQIPSRDAAHTNFNGTLIRKRPDLAFFVNASAYGISSSSLQHAWFCECKIIESVGCVQGRQSTTKTIQNYVAKGVKRFQAGDYAWAMPHAQMIAYVRGYTPDEMSANKTLIEQLGSSSFLQDGETVITNHPRHFTLTDGTPPGDITLRHLWFYI